MVYVYEASECELRDRFAQVPGGSIHYLEKGRPRPGTSSLVYCPGNWEPAWRAAPLLEGIDGHGLAITYRGHGKSFTPPHGYDLGDHVEDLHRVVIESDAQDICLVGFSRGVSYALGYFLAHPERVKGLVLMDAPPVHGRPTSGYVQYWRGKTYHGHRIRDHWKACAIAAMAREAQEVHFPELIPRLNIPVLVLRGTSAASPVPSNLSEEEIAGYRDWLPHAQIVELEHAGHMLLDEELGRCRSVIEQFKSALETDYCSHHPSI